MSRSTAKHDAIEARRVQVAQLVLGGATQRQIARALGVGVARINSDLHVLRKRWREAADIPTADHIALVLQKLDAWELALATAMSSGDTKAIDTGIRIEDRRCALLGLDAPRRVDQRVHGQLQAGPPIEELWTKAEQILVAEGWTPPSDEPNGNGAGNPQKRV